MVLFTAGALDLAQVSISLLRSVFPAQQPSPEFGFVTQALFPSSQALLGVGLFLAVFGLPSRATFRRPHVIGGGTVALAGGIGWAAAELLLYYALFFTRTSPQGLQLYGEMSVAFASLIPIGLGVLFLGFLADDDGSRAG
jgi:hypothetical protein